MPSKVFVQKLLYNRKYYGKLTVLQSREKLIEQLRKAVSIDPHDLGYCFSVWSLQKHLIKQTDIELAPNYLNELMKRHGIVHRRLKHDLSDKQQPQEVDEKKQLLDFLKKTQ